MEADSFCHQLPRDHFGYSNLVHKIWETQAMNTLTEGKMKQTKQKTITNGGL